MKVRRGLKKELREVFEDAIFMQAGTNPPDRIADAQDRIRKLQAEVMKLLKEA